MYVCLTPRVRASSEAVVVAAAVTFVDLPHPLGYYVRAFVYVRTDVRLHVSEQHDGLSQSVFANVRSGFFSRASYSDKLVSLDFDDSWVVGPPSVRLFVRPFIPSSLLT